MSPVLQLPASSYSNIAARSCSKCDSKFSAKHVRAAGIEVTDEETCCFFYDLLCPKCDLTTHFTNTSQPLSPQDWVKEIAFSCGYVVITGRKARGDRFYTIDHPSLGLNLLLRGKPLTALGVFGGYRDFEDEHVYVLARWARQHHSFDGVFRIDPQNRIRLVDSAVKTCLPPHQWEDFLLLAEGRSVEVLGRLMVKLHRNQIETIVRDRTFRLSNRVTDSP